MPKVDTHATDLVWIESTLYCKLEDKIMSSKKKKKQPKAPQGACNTSVPADARIGIVFDERMTLHEVRNEEVEWRGFVLFDV